jgi:hypothetical protein
MEKAKEETVGVGKSLLNFGQAIEALNQGKRTRRKNWRKEAKFIFRQVPSEVPAKFVPNMSSLPQTVKDYFEKTFNEEQIDAIYYDNQVALVGPSNLITNWSPSIVDSMANDWIVLD